MSRGLLEEVSSIHRTMHAFLVDFTVPNVDCSHEGHRLNPVGDRLKPQFKRDHCVGLSHPIKITPGPMLGLVDARL